MRARSPQRCSKAFSTPTTSRIDRPYRAGAGQQFEAGHYFVGVADDFLEWIESVDLV
jgi:hypothetical protein